MAHGHVVVFGVSPPLLLVFVAQSTFHRCKSYVGFFLSVSMGLYTPQNTKMTSLIFLMHILITKRTPAAPWRCRNAFVVHVGLVSLGVAPRARAMQLRWLTSDRTWRFGGYGRAQTQNHANATWQAPGESAIEGGRRTSLRSRRDFERKQLANAGADVGF